MPFPQITDTTIRQHASAESFLRGSDYFQQGAVLSLVQRGATLQAEVEGSEALPYIVRCDLCDRRNDRRDLHLRL